MLDEQAQAWTAGHVELRRLVQLPRNPKDHDVGQLILSIRRFGFVDPVVINQRTGRLLAGHGRDKALSMMRQQNMPLPTGIKEQNGDWLVPAYFVDVAEDEEEALAVALNRLTETGGWDLSVLSTVLSALAERGEDKLHGTGYTLDDVNDLIQLTAAPPSLDDLADEYGDPQPEDFWPVIRVKVPPPVYQAWERLQALRPDLSETQMMGVILDAVDQNQVTSAQVQDSD